MEHFWAIEINKGEGWCRLVWYDAPTRKAARARVKEFQSPDNEDYWEGMKFRIVHYQKVQKAGEWARLARAL